MLHRREVKGKDEVKNQFKQLYLMSVSKPGSSVLFVFHYLDHWLFLWFQNWLLKL